MPATYEPIATTTLGSAQASFSFTSIPGTYTDLVAVVVAASSGNLKIELNSDTGTNYSNTVLYGTGVPGSNALSARNINSTGLLFGTGANTVGNGVNLYHFMNYSNTTTNKTVFSRSGNNETGGLVRADIGLWRNTSAITSIRFISSLGADLATGSVFTLYGIKAA
jgi:hypothetical protein